MTDRIVTVDLAKSFGRVEAVREVSLHVKEGEIYGFLGLNGAGKTTTIRMMLGMMKPSSGQVLLFGRKVTADDRDLWNRVGYVVEVPYGYPDLTVRENLEIVRRLRLLPDSERTDTTMERLRIARYADRLAKHLSLGNAQRLGLAKAMIHGPQLLILDEPANGLDPAGIVEIRELLKKLASVDGVTIFISSHILGEISKFAHRIGIIHEGRLIEEIGTEDLDRLVRKRLLIRTRDNALAASSLRKMGYPPSLDRAQKALAVDSRNAIAAPDDIAMALANAGCPPLMLRVEEEDLEAYFLRIIGARQEATA
jgi:ABC-2 type transport system ATP-binding protein